MEPGSGVIGKIARSGDIPLGYYNDPKKTAEVFIQVEGTRYVMPGDYATVEEDGSITLLGRGSIVINSGGEKIFPEEVESAVRSHPDVMDAIVCGAPDERWGQTVAAIVQPRAGHEAPSLESLQEHCRESIAGYKLPRRLHVVDTGGALPVGQARLHVGGGASSDRRQEPRPPRPRRARPSPEQPFRHHRRGALRCAHHSGTDTQPARRRRSIAAPARRAARPLRRLCRDTCCSWV